MVILYARPNTIILYYGYHSSNHYYYYYAVHCYSDWLITILLYQVLLRVPMWYAAIQGTRTTVDRSSRPISLGPRNCYFFQTRNDTRFDLLDFTTRLTQLLNTENRTKPVNVKLICVMWIVVLPSSCQLTPWSVDALVYRSTDFVTLKKDQLMLLLN